MTTTTQIEQREARIKDAHDRLDRAVQAIKTTDDWTAWLKQASKFYKYSFYNVLLILSQCPNATLVAGASKWRTMGRFPRKGTKALWIFAPMLVNWSPAEIKVLPTRAGTKKFIGFKTVPVFDVSQTEGDDSLATKPLTPPERPKVELLEGEAPADVVRALRKMATDNGYTTSLGDTGDSSNGYTDFIEKTIVVDGKLSDAQRFKTFVHEIAHMILHSPEKDQPPIFCRADAEVEAESVAYIVCDHFGVKSDCYSFGCIAGWADRDLDAVKRTGLRVMQATKKILAVLDPEN
jgi:IrrE N-terminal-like domain